ncbi:hypothetical protein ACFQPA_17440 [Halomarina halobia]|uniref:Uncharacterized protein n=1 Tax=Halomarina halobia TaxID=3033386 RepID=A0ABD6AFI2_9EURY|nr:hypothetical protein [Halomarina sp. PSR21]
MEISDVAPYPTSSALESPASDTDAALAERDDVSLNERPLHDFER